MTAFVEINGLSKVFSARKSLTQSALERLGIYSGRNAVHAVDNVSLQMQRGETLGLVGESGCGKSTLGKVLAGIYDPSAGSITVDGAPVVEHVGNRRKLSTQTQTVFQDPFSSLDPRLKVGQILMEGPLEHKLIRKSEAAEMMAHWLRVVGLDPSVSSRFPHQFSGGQRQRIAIARALAMKPDLLICDEPVASLDVSIQAQIINLFIRLRREFGLTILFVSHDISVIRHLSDRVAVMYLGRIVEIGAVDDVLTTPAHPYTQALLASVPKLTLDDRDLLDFNPISGELPSPLSPPQGCHFHTRCPLVMDKCRRLVPAMTRRADDHQAACHLLTDAETGQLPRLGAPKKPTEL